MLVCLIEIAIKESIFHGFKSCLDMKRVCFTLQTYHHIHLSQSQTFFLRLIVIRMILRISVLLPALYPCP
jgi:hypothetical protein